VFSEKIIIAIGKFCENFFVFGNEIFVCMSSGRSICENLDICTVCEGSYSANGPLVQICM
jgi:hypothetical protein